MNQEIISVSWRDVSGNKYSRSLHPAMFQPGGYFKIATVRRNGYIDKAVYRVNYDRRYAINWLKRKVCVSLSPLELSEILDYVTEAYNL